MKPVLTITVSSNQKCGQFLYLNVHAILLSVWTSFDSHCEHYKAVKRLPQLIEMHKYPDTVCVRMCLLYERMVW